MLKYKQKIAESLDNVNDQIEKVITWVQYDRVTKEEHTKILGDINRKLNHISDLIDLEEG